MVRKTFRVRDFGARSQGMKGAAPGRSRRPSTRLFAAAYLPGSYSTKVSIGSTSLGDGTPQKSRIVEPSKQIIVKNPAVDFEILPHTQGWVRSGDKEGGEGTGPVIKKIIKKMNVEDHLDCIELDADYCAQLEEKFGEHENVHIHCMSITDFAPTQKYDVIVSTLPFNSLPPKLVQQVVDQYNEIIKPGGYITYIEYVVLGNVKRLVLSKEKKAAWDVKQQTLKEWFGRYGVERKIVWRNLPPSYVYYLKIDKVENEKEKSKTI